LWLPYGRRLVVNISPDDPPEFLRAQGVRHIVMNGNVLSKSALDRWLQQYDATLVGSYTFPRPEYKVATPDLYLVRLN
jgi:hypothetical protein